MGKSIFDAVKIKGRANVAQKLWFKLLSINKDKTTAKKLIQSERFISDQKLIINARPAQLYSTKIPPTINKTTELKIFSFISEVSIEIIIVLIRKVNIIFKGHQPLITCPSAIKGMLVIRPKKNRRLIVDRFEYFFLVANP